jgi:dTMP kinase
MRSARYICVEGTEGVGKTTQTTKIVEGLRKLGYRVLQTKEPGTPLSPLTMELRNIMLNAKYEPEITQSARELVSQAIRSIHLEKVVAPAFSEYDFIIQDRGILSGLAYGVACGHDIDWLMSLTNIVVKSATPSCVCSSMHIYDQVILLQGDVKSGLDKAAQAKQEFIEGDVIEMKGLSFMEQVNSNFAEYSVLFKTTSINIDGKSIDEVNADIMHALTVGSNDDDRAR